MHTTELNALGLHMLPSELQEDADAESDELGLEEALVVVDPDPPIRAGVGEGPLPCVITCDRKDWGQRLLRHVSDDSLSVTTNRESMNLSAGVSSLILVASSPV